MTGFEELAGSAGLEYVFDDMPGLRRVRRGNGFDYRNAGGEGPVYTQLHVCWAETEDEAEEIAHRVWPNTALPGQLAQDLRTPQHFEQAVEVVTPEMVAEKIPCGPDPERIVESYRKAIDSGVDHVYFHQIGPDQEGFFDWWESEVRPELTAA